MLAAFERAIEALLAPLAKELARLPEAAQRGIFLPY
jgi:hypothetical protein